MNSPTLLIRADASVAIGTGHVMRCLALAQAWQDRGGKAVVASGALLPAVRDRLLAENIEVVLTETKAGSSEDASWVADLAQQYDATWVVVDGYHFGAKYQRRLKRAKLRLLFLDDNGHAAKYFADFVLNQNVHAQESLYKNREAYTQLLLGPRYALVRREFRLWRDWKRQIPNAGGKILVSMGGSDAGNVTALVIPALNSISLKGLEVKIVAGGSNPHLESLERAIRTSGENFCMLTNVETMPELMAWADVILAAAGTICWEICAMGLPALLVVTADNQKTVARRLAALNAAWSLDSGTDKIAAECAPLLQRMLESQSIREELSAKARELVDMGGAARVVASLQEFAEL